MLILNHSFNHLTLCGALNLSYALLYRSGRILLVFYSKTNPLHTFHLHEDYSACLKITPVYKPRSTFSHAIKPLTVILGPYNYPSFLRYRCLLEFNRLPPQNPHLTPYFQDSDLKLTETRLA